MCKHQGELNSSSRFCSKWVLILQTCPCTGGGLCTDVSTTPQPDPGVSHLSGTSGLSKRKSGPRLLAAGTQRNMEMLPAKKDADGSAAKGSLDGIMKALCIHWSVLEMVLG